MFHTFAASTAEDQPEAGATSAKRQKSTLRACESCRKKKIRCDGEQPCTACQWYRKDAQCTYVRGSLKRPSRGTGESSSSGSEILKTLFPDTPSAQLAGLSKEKLLELAQNADTRPEITRPNASSSEAVETDDSDDVRSLNQFECFPDDNANGSGNAIKSDTTPNSVPGITDDVNGLSLSTDHSSSYLGISSVLAVLRAIAWLDPDNQAFKKVGVPNNSSLNTYIPSLVQSVSPSDGSLEPEYNATTVWDEIPAINGYFQYFQPLIPLLDEDEFRETYISGRRTDSRWLVLVNMVLAMGSMAISTPGNRKHAVFYKRAKEHIGVDLLGAPHLETVQALSILGGMYLHYIQEPNPANSMIGVAIRMAVTIGLHRDYSEIIKKSQRSTNSSAIDLRRRIWWSLLIMDAWNACPLGRPSMGRMSLAHTTKKPQLDIGTSPAIREMISRNIDFCVIATHLEDAIAIKPMLTASRRREFHTMFTEWMTISKTREAKNPISQGEIPGVIMGRNVMRWKCLSTQILIHRPVLLWYAMRGGSRDMLSDDKKESITICRGLATTLIDDIAASWKEPCAGQVPGWFAIWQLYLATLVPLLSLYCDSTAEEVVGQCRSNVETAMNIFMELTQWSSTARRTLDVVSSLYEGSKIYKPRPRRQSSQQRSPGSTVSHLLNPDTSSDLSDSGHPDQHNHLIQDVFTDFMNTYDDPLTEVIWNNLSWDSEFI